MSTGSIEETVCRVEFTWKGRVDLLFFPKPKEASALSPQSRMDMESNINMENKESKLADFLDRSQDLVAEMLHLSKISERMWFRVLQTCIPYVRYLTFTLSVLINLMLALSVKATGPDCHDDGNGKLDCGNSGFPYSDDAVVIQGMTPHTMTTYGLIFLGTLHFGTVVYQLTFRAPLIWDRLKRARDANVIGDDDDDDGDDEFGGGDEDGEGEIVSEEISKGAKPTQYEVLNRMWFFYLYLKVEFQMDQKDRLYLRNLGANLLPPIFTAIFIVCVWFVISCSAFHEQVDWTVVIAASGIVEVLVLFPAIDNFCTDLRTPHRKPGVPGYFFSPVPFIVLPYGWVFAALSVLQAGYRIFTMSDMLIPVAYCYLSFHGTYHYYLASLLLLDCIFLSDRLQLVINAVVIPAKDIFATFVLMGFCVFIFTSFGMYQFGGNVVFFDDALSIADDAKQIVIPDATGWTQCPNLAVCFLEFFDVGLRSGDIVDATFDDITYQDGLRTWFDRIVFGKHDM